MAASTSGGDFDFEERELRVLFRDLCDRLPLVGAKGGSRPLFCDNWSVEGAFLSSSRSEISHYSILC